MWLVISYWLLIICVIESHTWTKQKHEQASTIQDNNVLQVLSRIGIPGRSGRSRRIQGIHGLKLNKTLKNYRHDPDHVCHCFQTLRLWRVRSSEKLKRCVDKLIYFLTDFQIPKRSIFANFESNQSELICVRKLQLDC